MVTIKIYIEGEGEGKDMDIRFREAWTRFFKSAGLTGRMPKPIRGKGRAHTFDLFSTAIQNGQIDTMPLLLLDSEEKMISDQGVWQHLKALDGWEKPTKSTENHAYLMVQVMETWFLADLPALQNYFGSKFKISKIPAWTDLESQPKQSVFGALSKATSACNEKRYAKGKISFEILGKINPILVQQKCSQAKRLFDFLATKI